MRLEAKQRLIFGITDALVTLVTSLAFVRVMFWALGQLEVEQTWYELIGLTAAQLLSLSFSVAYGGILSSIAAWATFRRIGRPPARAQTLTLVGSVIFVFGFDVLASDFPSGLPGLFVVAASQYLITWGLTRAMRWLYLERFAATGSVNPRRDSPRQMSD